MEKREDMITVTRKQNNFDKRWVKRTAFEEANRQYMRDMDTMCAKNHGLRKEAQGLRHRVDELETTLKFSNLSHRQVYDDAHNNGVCRGLIAGTFLSAFGWFGIYMAFSYFL